METVTRKPSPATHWCDSGKSRIYSILSSEVGLTIMALRISVKRMSSMDDSNSFLIFLPTSPAPRVSCP